MSLEARMSEAYTAAIYRGDRIAPRWQAVFVAIFNHHEPPTKTVMVGLSARQMKNVIALIRLGWYPIAK